MKNIPEPLQGIGLLVLSTVSLAALDTSGKWIMAAGLPLLVMSWVRYVGLLVRNRWPFSLHYFSYLRLMPRQLTFWHR